jgi:hypothetical protein
MMILAVDRFPVTANRESECGRDEPTLKTADPARRAPSEEALWFLCKIDFLEENALFLVAAMS